MKGNDKVIQTLNDILTAELTSINQYFIHAKMNANWGFKKLADKIRDESIDEMKHADKLIERILFLEGLPNLQKLNKLMIGENPREMIGCDLKLEEMAIPDLKEAIAYCETVRDFGTRELLEDILESEEEHVDWLETQIGLMNSLGDALYLQGKVGAS